VRLSLKGIRSRQPISSSSCSLKGRVSATYSLIGSIEFRRNPNPGMNALAANTSDLARTVRPSPVRSTCSRPSSTLTTAVFS